MTTRAGAGINSFNKPHTGGVLNTACSVFLFLMVFVSAGVVYAPVVVFDVGARLDAGTIRDPFSLLGTLATTLSAVISGYAIASRAWRPRLALTYWSVSFSLLTALALLWGRFSLSALGGSIKGVTFVISLSFCIDKLGSRRAAKVIVYAIACIAATSTALIVLDKRFAGSGSAASLSKYTQFLDVFGWRGLFVEKNWLAAFCLAGLVFWRFVEDG